MSTVINLKIDGNSFESNLLINDFQYNNLLIHE